MKKSKTMKKAHKRTSDTRWTFSISDMNDIDFEELVGDLTRRNPVAFGSIMIKKVRESAQKNYIQQTYDTIPEELFFEQTGDTIPEELFFVALQSGLVLKAVRLDIGFNSNIPNLDKTNILFQSNDGIVIACDEENFHNIVQWAKKVKHTKEHDTIKARVKVVLPTI